MDPGLIIFGQRGVHLVFGLSETLLSSLILFSGFHTSEVPLNNYCRLFLLLIQHIRDVLGVQLLDEIELSAHGLNSLLDGCPLLQMLALFHLELVVLLV